MRIRAGHALVALAADVEHAVIDADGQSDQQHHVHGRVDRRGQAAGEGEQAHRGDDSSDGERDRQQRRHHRAERDQQNPERHRNGQQGQAGQALVEFVADELVGARVARLRDVETRMPCLHGGYRVERRLDPVLGRLGIAGKRERHQRGRPVRRLDGVGHRADAAQRLPYVGHRSRAVVPSDDHHLLCGRDREAGLRDDPVGTGGLAVALLDRRRLAGSQLSTQDRYADDKGDPAQDR